VASGLYSRLPVTGPLGPIVGLALLIYLIRQADRSQPIMKYFLSVLVRLVLFTLPILILNLNFLFAVPDHWPVPLVIYLSSGLWLFSQYWLWIFLGLGGRYILATKLNIVGYSQRFPLYAGIACALFDIYFPPIMPRPWAVSYVVFAPFLYPMTIFSSSLYTFTTFWLANFLANWKENQLPAKITLCGYLLVLGLFSLKYPLAPPSVDTAPLSIKLVNQDYELNITDSMSPEEKLTTLNRLNFKKQELIDLSVTNNPKSADLVILAESAYTFEVPQSMVVIGDDFHDAAFRDGAKEMHSDMLIGTYLSQVESNQTTGTNSAVLINREGKVAARYDKRLLIPFFEGLGANLSGKIMGSVLGLKNLYHPGVNDRALATSSHTPFIVLICYEIYFSDFVRDAINKAANSQFIVNMSKDLLVTNTVAVEQMNAQIRIRAIEFQMPIVRSASFGPSGVFNRDGSYHVVNSSPDGVSAFDELKLAKQTGSLFLTWGYAPLLALFVLLILIEVALYSVVARFKARPVDL